MNTRLLSALVVVLCLSGAALAKDPPRVTIKVLDTETSERQSAYTVAGSPSVSKTTCNESESQNSISKDNGRTVRGAVNTDSSSTCTTVAQPATPPSTRVLSVRQENVQAVMADGTNVTLWCQQGFRQCVSLLPGSYSAEVDGNTVWVYIRELSGKEHKVKYKAVAVSNSAPAKGDDGA